MTYDSPHLYRRGGVSLGVPSDVLDSAVRQLAELSAAGVTPVLTLNHLARLTGASYPYLRKVVERKIDPYQQFSRRRRGSGKMRLISSPDPVLMVVQRWILDRILSRVAGILRASPIWRDARSPGVHAATSVPTT